MISRGVFLVRGFSKAMANNLVGKWKMNMNSFNDCFNIGSTVSCRTCYHKEIEGEVLAFDAPTKILILSILFIYAL